MKARELALTVVRDVFPLGRTGPERGAQESLDYRARKTESGARERAFATELAYGAIKMRRTLEWYLQPFVGDRLGTLPSAIGEILRLGVYELLYTRADAHATVFEFVNLAKRYGHRGLANLVNAVLRNVLRDPPAPPQHGDFSSADEYLGVRYSLPDWLVRRWRDAFDGQTEAVCAAVNDPARAALTVNALRTSRDEIAAFLRETGVAVAPSEIVPESLLVEHGAGLLAGLEAESTGRWWMQSESSAMVAGVLDPQPGEAILDLCSGRGNKALQIAARIGTTGSLTCVERNPAKVRALSVRLERAGATAAIVTGDASAEILPPAALFDRVLVDAPCSGIGVVGRHPEARWKKQAGDGERLAVTQTAILDRAASHVRAGGTLVYAVCSNDTRETTAVLEKFAAGTEFLPAAFPAAYEPFLGSDGTAAVSPGIGGRDGFFFARLVRR